MEGIRKNDPLYEHNNLCWSVKTCNTCTFSSLCLWHIQCHKCSCLVWTAVTATVQATVAPDNTYVDSAQLGLKAAVRQKTVRVS